MSFLEWSQCKETDSLFNQIPVMCPVLKFFLLQDCQEIREEAYINSNLKTHEHLKILNVADNRQAVSQEASLNI